MALLLQRILFLLELDPPPLRLFAKLLLLNRVELLQSLYVALVLRQHPPPPVLVARLPRLSLVALRVKHLPLHPVERQE
jgi:hypothetical protein